MDSTLDSEPRNERRDASWDIRNAPRNYLSLVVTQGGSAFFAFASIWLLTKYLGKEGYGGIVAIIAASQVAQMLANWTVTAVLRFGVDEFVETGKIARIFWLRFLVLGPQALLVLLSSVLWFPVLADWLKLPSGIYWYVVAHFLTACIWVHIQYGLQGAKLQRLQGALMMIERMLIAFGLTGLIYFERLTAISAILIYSAIPLVLAAAGFWLLRGLVFSRFSFERKFLWKIFSYSFPLLPFTILGYFTTGYLDAVFIAKFISIAELGVYSIAIQANGIILQLPTLANSLLIPLFVTLEKESDSKKTAIFFSDILPALVLFWGLGCTILSFIGYYGIPFAFSEEFASAGKPLWILLVSSIAAFPVLVGYVALVHSTSNTVVALIASIVTASVNVCLNFLLIPAWGIEGCAWATSAAFLANAAIYAAQLKRRIGMVISWTFPAMIPGIGSALSLSITGNAIWSLAVCFFLTFTIAYLQKDSLFATIRFLKNFAVR